MIAKLLSALVVLSCIVAISAPVNASPSRGEVVVYNWSEYIPSDVLDDFTKETGIKVLYSTYETNDAMYSKVKLLQGKSYDLICPSTYYLHLLIEDGMLAKFDHSKLSNFKNLDPIVLNKEFDPSNEYSIPYMWGTFGMLINTDIIKDESKAKSWKDLLRPEYKGLVILSDDMRDTFGMAMRATGHSANSKDPEEIKAGYDFLKQLYPSVRIFDITAVKQAFVSEEVAIGTSWNGDALVAQAEAPYLKFIYPEEGVLVWIDSFAIPKGAENVENAYEFVNFMLRPDIAKRCQAEYKYSTPNSKTIELLSVEDKENRTLVPTEVELKNSETLINVGAKTLDVYKNYWEKVKSSRSN